MNNHLISHSDKDGEQIPVADPDEFLLDLRLGKSCKVPSQLAQNGNGDHKVVTVRLYEVVPRYARRIYVMLSKRP